MSKWFDKSTHNAQIQALDSQRRFLGKWVSEGGRDGEFYFPTRLALDKESFHRVQYPRWS